MDKIKYIDREGLSDISEFIFKHANQGIEVLRKLESDGVNIVHGNQVVVCMDSLGFKNKFTITNPWQMTDNECQKTVEVLNVLLGCKWEFKELI